MLVSTPSERNSSSNIYAHRKTQSVSFVEDGLFVEVGNYIKRFSSNLTVAKENKPPGRTSIQAIDEMPKNNSKGPSNSGVADNGQSDIKKSFEGTKGTEKASQRRKSAKESGFFTRPDSLMTVKQTSGLLSSSPPPIEPILMSVKKHSRVHRPSLSSVFSATSMTPRENALQVCRQQQKQ